VKITCVVILGLTERAPIVKALMLRSTCGIGLAAMKPSLPLLLMCPATTPLRYWALVDVAEEAGRVLRVLAFRPHAAAVGEADVRVLRRDASTCGSK
jgi:hypothetical protein